MNCVRRLFRLFPAPGRFAAVQASPTDCRQAPPRDRPRSEPRSGRCRARVFRFLPVLAVLSAALSPFADAPAAAELVKNTGQTTAFNAASTAAATVAQGFTTGSNPGGYTLSSVQVTFNRESNAAMRATIRAELWSDSSGVPGSKIASLTVPAGTLTGDTSFAAPSGTKLRANTTYHAVFYTVGDWNPGFLQTNANAEDAGGASGWSIADSQYSAAVDEPDGSSSWSADASGNSLEIIVSGQADQATWRVTPSSYAVQEGVPARIVVELSDPAPDGGVPFTAEVLFGADARGTGALNGNGEPICTDVDSSDPVNPVTTPKREAAAADVGANPPSGGTVPAGSTRGEISIPIALDVLKERDECFAVKLSITATGWEAVSQRSAVQVLIFDVDVSPKAPADLVVTPGGDQLELSWTAPTQAVATTVPLTGDFSLTGYDVHVTRSLTVDANAAVGSTPATEWVAVEIDVDAASSSGIVGLLTAGTEYRVRVRAKNAYGAGPWVVGKGTAGTLVSPGVPRSVSVASGNASLTLNWDAPASWGSWPADFFQVQMKRSSDDDSRYDTIKVGGEATYPKPTDTSVVLTGTQTLDNGTDYTVTNGIEYSLRIRTVTRQVAEINTRTTSNWVTVSGTPQVSAPGNFRVTPGDGELALSWDAPEGTVTGYDLGLTSAPKTGAGAVADDAPAVVGPDLASGWIDIGRTSAKSYTIPDLPSGTVYRARVRAKNGDAVGPWAHGSGSATALPAGVLWQSAFTPGDLGGGSISAACLRAPATPRSPATASRSAARRSRSVICFSPNLSVP